MLVTERIKNEIKAGDVLLSFNKSNLLSKAIADITHSDFSHAFLYIGNNKILESSTHGVAIKDLEYYLNYDKYYLAVFRPDIINKKAKELVEFCLSLRGVKYGYLQIFYLFLLFHLGLKDTKWLQLDLPGVICSELVALGLEHIKWYPFGEKMPSHIVPGDYAKELTRIV